MPALTSPWDWAGVSTCLWAACAQDLSLALSHNFGCTVRRCVGIWNIPVQSSGLCSAVGWGRTPSLRILRNPKTTPPKCLANCALLFLRNESLFFLSWLSLCFPFWSRIYCEYVSYTPATSPVGEFSIALTSTKNQVVMVLWNMEHWSVLSLKELSYLLSIFTHKCPLQWRGGG